MTSPVQKSIWRSAALRWGGSAVILALLFFVLRKHLPELVETLRRVPPGTWLLFLLGYMCAHVIGVTKWRLMVNLAGAKLSWPVAARCYFAGLFGNVFLPSIVGGDVIRAGLGMTAGRNRAGVLLGSFLDRLLDVAALAILAGTGALLLPRALDERARRVFLVLAALSFLGLLSALTVWRLFPRRLPMRVRRKVVKLRQAARSMAARKQYVALALFMGTAMQFTFLALNAQFGVLASLDIPLYLWLFAFPLAKLSAMLPLTQGGIGVREAALAALLAPFGAPPQRTVAVGLLWETIVIAGGLLGGLIALILSRTLPQARAPQVSAAAREI